MAPRKKTTLPPCSPLRVGYCEVTVEGATFTHESDPNGLRIIVSRKAKISIAVKRDGSGDPSKSDEAGISEHRGKGNGQKHISAEDGYRFELVNLKDTDRNSKSLLQEVLRLYKEELPAMRFAANTGKESTFLERCISNGKYRTLILRSKSSNGQEEVLAAITYQIVPADTQYAEIPVAAVSSTHQKKGFGRLLFSELRNRLHRVGVCTLLCWGDKDSEGFWSKQGFVSVAEVDSKGRARRVPIRADIRRALCFPGGSTLMVSHLNRTASSDPSHSLNSCVNKCKADDSVHAKEVDCETIVRGGSFANIANTDSNRCQCSGVGRKRTIWESTLSSLKSKKVKGGHSADCQLHSNQSPSSEKNFCSAESSLGISGDHHFAETISKNPLAALKINELQSKGGCFRIMLMNIADDSKKTHLTKVIEDLGGVRASDGSESTHIVTGKARRTLNFCVGLCSGAWIVSSVWLKESFRQGRFLDEGPYILDDQDYTSKYRSDLKDAVLRARARPHSLLEGYDVCISPHVQPPLKTLTAIVTAAGGNVVGGLDRVKDPSKTVFIACEEDMEDALVAVKKGVWTFGTEWLMSSVMKHELDFEAPQFAESL